MTSLERKSFISLFLMSKSSKDMSSKRHFHLNNEASSDGRLTKAKQKPQTIVISKWRSVITSFSKNRSPPSLGSRVVGTLFGTRDGPVNFSFQREPKSNPAFQVELSTPITSLVKEMASGMVKIALECDKGKNDVKLTQEPFWRTYCNGKKYGIGERRECQTQDSKVLKAVEMISTGAGVLPGNASNDIIYMRAKFVRVVGSKDCEAYYMMNPDCNAAPELSIYLLRL